MFPDFMRKRRVFLWMVIGYVVAAYIVSILTTICICLPPSENWSVPPIRYHPPSRFLFNLLMEPEQVFRSCKEVQG